MGCAASTPHAASTGAASKQDPSVAGPTKEAFQIPSAPSNPPIPGFRAPPSAASGGKPSLRLFRNRLQPVREDSQEPTRVGSLLPGAQRRTAPPERVEWEDGPLSWSFLGRRLRVDPAKILWFLEEEDRHHLACCSKASWAAVRAFNGVFFAKLETKPAWEMWDWARLNVAGRGQGAQWHRLKRRLLRAPQPQHTSRMELMEDVTPEMFAEKYEAARLPVVLRGGMDRWSVMREFSSLDAALPKYGNCLFRFNDLHGEVIALKDWAEYVATTQDDSPLGLYDSQFGAHGAADPRTQGVLNGYAPPACFGRDLFESLPEDSRPPYRWILLGSAHSGTEMHVDPLGTSAWVALVAGRKRWVMFPPETDLLSIGGAHTSEKRWTEPSPPPSAVEWFQNWWGSPVMERAVPGFVEILQHPGEIVFVPGGWPHIVINLETTIAMTHNYAPESAWPRVRESLRTVEPEMYEELVRAAPHLA